MRHRIAIYVTATCALALIGVMGVVVVAPSTGSRGVAAAICFATLGFFAQALGHAVGKDATGNISFIPFLAIALLSPDLTAVASVCLSVAVVEINARREWIKGIFNVGQYTLAIALGVLVYRAIGGVAFLSYRQAFTNFSDQSAAIFLPSLGLVVVFLLANNSAVSGVIAISENRRFREVWRATALRAVVYDVLSLPFVLMLVAAYSIAGAIGAMLLAAPMLAVRQLYKTNWQLQRANQDLLQLMVAAIEARDPYTSGHSRRVSQNARVIAEAIGLRSRDVEAVATAALLHDVGKIYEEFAVILQKPGKLTPEERQIMETHPRKSAELVSTVSHLQPLVKSVLHHHENWDGTGYPDKLSGEQIPLASRIIMIADTVDAMTTDRPYRKALGETEVRRELLKYQGTQFDPRICEALLASPRFAELFESATARRDTAQVRSLLPRALRLRRASA